MSYILLTLEIVIVLFFFYAKKRIEQGLKRETSYESEKGKNIATKEDIKAVDRFSIPRIAKKWEEVIVEIIEGRG